MNKKISLYFIIALLNCSNSNSYNNNNIHFSDIALCSGVFFLIGSCGYLLYKQVMKQYRIQKKIRKIFIEEKKKIQEIIENNMGIINLYKQIIISEQQAQNVLNHNKNNNHKNHNIIINNIVNSTFTEEHTIIKNKFLEIIYKIIKVIKNNPLFEDIQPEINSWFTPINIKEIIISILLDENFIIQHII